MKFFRYCCFIILAAVLFFFSGCVDQQAPTKIELPSDMIVEEDFLADLNNDGMPETIIIASCDSESVEYEDFITLYVSGGLELYKIDITDGSYESAFITATDSGKPCLLINTAFIDYNAEMFSFNGIEPVLRESISGLVTKVSGSEITIEDDTDVFGSWYYTRDFILSDDFTLKPVSDYRIKMVDQKESLHTIKKLPVEILIEGVYVQQTLNEDTYIYPISTDGISYMNFRLEDGSEGRITYTYEDYKFYIDGIHEDEYFDNIGYWG